MTDDGSLFCPIFIGDEENTSCIHLIWVFEDVKFLELFVVETELLDELRITEDEEWSIADVG